MIRNNLQPMYKRQRFLLSFIRQLDEGVTSVDLQKLVFLYTMQMDSEFYEFIPYKFGSYSFQLEKDVDVLCRDGYLTNEGQYIQAAGDYQTEAMFPIAAERGDKLIRKEYYEYPYYTINSEIIDQIFYTKESEQLNCRKSKYRQTDQVLFTIGYEGRGIEAFMNILIQNDIRLLGDVRKNPFSRKFGFSKKKLEHITDMVGIKYVHIPALGIESNKRRSLDSVDDYQCLFKEYAKMLRNSKQQLEYLYSLLQTNVRIALMCFEKEPEMCHRHVITEHLANMYKIRSVNL